MLLYVTISIFVNFKLSSYTLVNMGHMAPQGQVVHRIQNYYMQSKLQSNRSFLPGINVMAEFI